MREFDGKCFLRKINQHEKRVSQEREFVFVAKEDVNGGWGRRELHERWSPYL